MKNESGQYVPFHFRKLPTGYRCRSIDSPYIYELTRQPDGSLFCPCESYAYSRAPKSCKHVQAAERCEVEGARHTAELIARWRNDPDGETETAVQFDGPLPDMGGLLVKVTKPGKVEKYNGIAI